MLAQPNFSEKNNKRKNITHKKKNTQTLIDQKYSQCLQTMTEMFFLHIVEMKTTVTHSKLKYQDSIVPVEGKS